MAIYGAFAAPIAGMLAQSQAFGAISQNITNMNTGGYKAANTRFSTVLASKFGNNSDIGGVLPVNKNYISQQGRILSTNSALDVALNGNGMFVLNTEGDGTGDTLYSRDGGFQLRVYGTDTVTLSDNTTRTVDTAYLVDKNGYFVQAWEPDANGAFSTSSTLGPIRLDYAAFSSEAQATEGAVLAANLPAESSVGDEYVTSASVYDSEGELRSFEFVWKRQTDPQTWTMRVRSDVDTPANSNILGAGTTPSLGSEQTFVFGTDGKLAADTTQDVTIDFGTDPDVTFTVDISDVTSIGQSFIYQQFQKDGRGPGELLSYQFDNVGQIVGKFSNGVERALYKLPVATFVNADGLEALQGNLYAESVYSGSATLRQVSDPAINAAAGNSEKHEFASFVPYAHELSNTNLEQEFSLMILTQQAYNSSATVFKTVDEMTKTASELKT